MDKQVAEWCNKSREEALKASRDGRAVAFAFIALVYQLEEIKKQLERGANE